MPEDHDRILGILEHAAIEGSLLPLRRVLAATNGEKTGSGRLQIVSEFG